MARITTEYLKSQGDVYRAILDGEYDGVGLENLSHAIALRKKTMFRKNTKVRVTAECNSGELVGREGVVIKVNSTRITVGLGERQPWGGYESEYGFPPRMLEVVS